jgi:ribosomal 50S subunit-recycling heat shock protein
MQKKIRGKIKRLRPLHYIVIFLILVIYIGAVIGIINYRAGRVVNPPKLEISSPVDGDTYSTDSIVIQGDAAPRAKVNINGQEVQADKDGKYSATLPLSVGQNTFSIKTIKGKLSTEKKVTVNRVAPEPVVQKTEQPPVITNGELNNSGPETLWFLEAGSLAAVGAAWQTSRKRLKKAYRG